MGPEQGGLWTGLRGDPGGLGGESGHGAMERGRMTPSAVRKRKRKAARVSSATLPLISAVGEGSGDAGTAHG